MKIISGIVLVVAALFTYGLSFSADAPALQKPEHKPFQQQFTTSIVGYACFPGGTETPVMPGTPPAAFTCPGGQQLVKVTAQMQDKLNEPGNPQPDLGRNVPEKYKSCWKCTPAGRTTSGALISYCCCVRNGQYTRCGLY